MSLTLRPSAVSVIPQLRGAGRPSRLALAVPTGLHQSPPPLGSSFRFGVFPRMEESLPPRGFCVHNARHSSRRLVAISLSREDAGDVGLRLSPEPRDPEAAAAPRGPPRSVSWGPVPRPQVGPGCSSLVGFPLPEPGSVPCRHELPPLLLCRATRAGAREARREDWGRGP